MKKITLSALLAISAIAGSHLQGVDIDPITYHQIKSLADINQLNDKGETLLFESIQNEKENITDYLLSIGADPNAGSPTMKKPLYYAVRYAKKEIIQKLLDAGANKYITEDETGDTLLHCAVLRHVKSIRGTKKLIDIIKVLIDYGINPDAINKEGLTPLHYAARFAFFNDDIVKTLITKKAPINAQSKNGDTPLHWAVISKKLLIVELLLNTSGINLSLTNKNGKTALELAEISPFTAKLADAIREKMRNPTDGGGSSTGGGGSAGAGD